MPKPENIIGRGFDKNPQNINRKGRPPRLVGKVILELKEAGYEPVSPEQVRAIYETLLNLPEQQLMTLVNDKEQPMLARIIGRAMLGKYGYEIIERMLDRAHGKAKQSSDVQVSCIEPMRIEFVKHACNTDQQ